MPGSGVRADADNSGETGTDPEEIGEVRRSRDAGERGSSLESIGGGPSQAGKCESKCESSAVNRDRDISSVTV